jgi:hypothetical protein
MTELVHEPKGTAPRTLIQTVRECNAQIYAWSTLMRKAARTLRATKNPWATMMAWQSNINYRNVALAPTSFT